MNYSEHPPHPLLAPYIKCFWSLEAKGYPGDAAKEKILPDGCMELIFHYGDAYRQYYQDTADVQQKSFAYGQLTEYIQVGPTGNTGIVGVRFYSYGFSAFTHIPVHHFTQNTTGLQDIWGRDGTELEERIMLARNNAERIKILTNFFIGRHRSTDTRHKLLTHAAKQISFQKGNVRVSELAKELFISERSLERQFMSGIGMSPKTLARISRFQYAFNVVQRAEISSLTELAYNTGYYDQAHFIKDFRAFTGESPSQYFGGNNEMASLFTGSE